MAFSKKRFSQILHIKQHTKGTSNEISVSVLDARKGGADTDEVKEKKKTKVTFAGVFSPSPLVKASNIAAQKRKTLATGPSDSEAITSAEISADHEQEISRRKIRRRVRRSMSALLSAMVIVAGLGGSFYFLTTEYQNQTANQSLLSSALDKVKLSDETIVKMDQIMSVSVDEENVVKMAEVQLALPETKMLLKESEALVKPAFDNLRDSPEKEAAGRTLSTIESRYSMIEVGDRVMRARINAYTAGQQIDEAWKLILDADEATRKAAALILSTTPENAIQSREENDFSLSQFNRAKVIISGTASAYVSADLHLLQDYVDKRIEATQYALLSDDAILLQDKKTAETNNDLYNQADAQAVAIANQFPPDPKQPIYDAFDVSVESSLSTYKAARSAAGAADSFLREYLGTASK